MPDIKSTSKDETGSEETIKGGLALEIPWVIWRFLLKVVRNPFVLFFSLFMPIIWLLMFSQTFGSLYSSAQAGALPPGMTGPVTLPYDYVAVLLPGIIIMTAIQSSSQSGFQMVSDIETGFMDKFFVAPIHRSSVLIGKLSADGIRMAIQASIIVGLAALLDAIGAWRIPFATGLPGLVIVVLLATSFGVAFSGLSNTVALRTRNTESTMLVSFTLTFPLLFLSTAMLPRDFLPGWVQTFSSINPVSYVADAARPLILTGYEWTAIGQAFIAIAVFGIILNGAAVLAFRSQGK